MSLPFLLLLCVVLAEAAAALLSGGLGSEILSRVKRQCCCSGCCTCCGCNSGCGSGCGGGGGFGFGFGGGFPLIITVPGAANNNDPQEADYVDYEIVVPDATDDAPSQSLRKTDKLARLVLRSNGSEPVKKRRLKNPHGLGTRCTQHAQCGRNALCKTCSFYKCCACPRGKTFTPDNPHCVLKSSARNSKTVHELNAEWLEETPKLIISPWMNAASQIAVTDGLRTQPKGKGSSKQITA